MIDTILLIKLLWFILPAIVGVIYAYSWKWVELTTDKTWTQYMFGDRKALIKVILVFVASCAGVISLDYLNMLDNIHLAIAGISFGLLIPQKVEAKSISKTVTTVKPAAVVKTPGTAAPKTIITSTKVEK